MDKLFIPINWQALCHVQAKVSAHVCGHPFTAQFTCTTRSHYKTLLHVGFCDVRWSLLLFFWDEKVHTMYRT